MNKKEIWIKENISSISIQELFRQSIGANDFTDVFLLHKQWGDRMHNSQKIKRDLNWVGHFPASIFILAITTHIFLL